MDTIWWLLLTVNALFLIRFVWSGWKVRFSHKLMFDDTFWARVGLLMAFNGIVFVMVAVLTYIGAIVAAAN